MWMRENKGRGGTGLNGGGEWNVRKCNQKEGGTDLACGRERRKEEVERLKEEVEEIEKEEVEQWNEHVEGK